MQRLLLLFLILPGVSSSAHGELKAPKVDFVRSIRPIFESRCFECHGPTRQRGGLRLDTSNGIKTGGQSGAILEPNKASVSLLLLHVRGVGEHKRMPPKGDPLSAEQIALLQTWIEQGASLPAEAKSELSAIAGNWAFKPIVSHVPPAVPVEQRPWVRGAIDAFVLQKLLANDLQPSAEADRSTLARRLSIDLTGLPPTPEELKAFLADRSPDAYERLVDRLLRSPRYGERWARHWLDVAHYADSHGHDQDRFRPNAWPYRDYLIRSFNEDKPYARFAQEQIAGDVLFPGDSGAVVGTGFLAAGPWDESGLRDISENSIDRQIARYLDRDDIVTSTMTTFAGLTVHCARCHDHKFDPITQSDYYAMQAVFAGVDKAERAFDADPAIARRRHELTTELQSIRNATDSRWLTDDVRRLVADFEKARREADTRWMIPEPSSVSADQGTSLRMLLDRSVLAVGPAPERDVYHYRATLPASKLPWTGLRLELLCDDSLPKQGPGRAVNGNLHLSEMRVRVQPRHGSKAPVSVKLKSAVADFNQTDWEVHRTLDNAPQTAWGIHPEEGKPHWAVFELDQPMAANEEIDVLVDLEQLHGGSHLIGRFRIAFTSVKPVSIGVSPLPPAIQKIVATDDARRSEAERIELARWVRTQQVEQEIASLPATSLVYCGTNRFTAQGSFRPALQPRPIHVLGRGEINKPGAIAEPGTIATVDSLPARFKLTRSDDEGERRAALANWLVSPDNPLTWRVIVNRVWHYHFGRGIVDTPNDFGAMGGSPSHPELLDWLANDFRAKGGSIKELHRTIVTSSTYRQATTFHAKAAEKDASNRLLWRMNRGRLDAESLRDAVLQASGQLDVTMYGPPIQHFVTKPGIHVTPDADYEKYNLDGPGSKRRSIYRFIFRTRPDPMLEALDCPDASQSAPVRSTSVSAIQSLVLWNNRFMLRHAEHLAQLAVKESPTLPGQITFVCQRTLLRTPTPEEEKMWLAFAQKHGLANLVRVLFNSSEFAFVD